MKYLKIKFAIPLVLIIGSICFALNSNSKSDEKNPNCVGKDRWGVKTLTDADEASVNFNPENTTVNTLINIPLRKVIKYNTRRFGIEFNSYSLKCRIREYKLSSDGDYHLVLEDIDHPEITMIGEIPDPYCPSVQKSNHLEAFIQARKDFKNSLLFAGKVDTSIYTITGIAFYDKVHGQLGAAQNAIEIHPILSISK